MGVQGGWAVSYWRGTPVGVMGQTAGIERDSGSGELLSSSTPVIPVPNPAASCLSTLRMYVSSFSSLILSSLELSDTKVYEP